MTQPVPTQNKSIPCSSSTLLLFSRLLCYGTFSDSPTLNYRFWKQRTSFHKVMEGATVNADQSPVIQGPRMSFLAHYKELRNYHMKKRLKHLRKVAQGLSTSHSGHMVCMALPHPGLALVPFLQGKAVPSKHRGNRQTESKAKLHIKVYSRT